MPARILGGVLPFTEDVRGWRPKNLRAILLGTPAVFVDVFHAHHRGGAVSAVTIVGPLDNNDRAAPER